MTSAQHRTAQHRTAQAPTAGHPAPPTAPTGCSREEKALSRPGGRRQADTSGPGVGR
ncbi:hypothetical protein EDD38_7214 [Kitasatospora cineracea]|uniref:Uncharacterized protein n=1 Tax=Kitasatospora cineracea TaxID=88074 RepID=A0A3N4RB97_9ACTN|nr:hypothetical protein EDD38_7214 [Kitasatospora cineracea]